jgi:hypothetical protein
MPFLAFRLSPLASSARPREEKEKRECQREEKEVGRGRMGGQVREDGVLSAVKTVKTAVKSGSQDS